MANNNYEDPNQDDQVDFEPEGDFSEFEDEKNPSSFGETLKSNPLLKLFLIAAGVIVIVGGLLMFGGEDVEAPQSSIGAGNDIKETPGTKELTPMMTEAMEDMNEQRLQEAVSQGGSVMPVPIQPPKNFLDVPTDTSANEDPLQRWRLMQEERLRVQREQEQLQIQQAQQQQGGQGDPAAEQAIQGLATAMLSQMSQIVGGNNQTKMSYMKVTAEQTAAALAGTGTSGYPATGAVPAGMTVGPDGQLIPLEPLDIVISAGSIVYAQLLNEANSDVEGPIVALVAQGPFSGSRVLGTFTKKEELLVLQFTTLISKEGFSVPITAYAMDPDTTLVGMATDVDHRYWKRVVLPAAAEFVAGMGEAIAESGTTVTISNSTGTTVTEDSGDIDTKEQAAKGVERAFDRVSDILDEEGNATEVLVIVKAGTPLGILFMEPVTKQAIEQARFGMTAASGQRAQAQQGQPYNPMMNMMGMNGMGQQGYPAYGQQGYNTGYQGASVPNNYGFETVGPSNTPLNSVMQSLQSQQAIQTGSR